jgi:putative ABC transport system permease protein
MPLPGWSPGTICRLQGFAYRIMFSSLYFLPTGSVALVIAWATVFVHVRRVASANPIHGLRHE